VLGNTFTPQTERRAHSQEGVASWYGRRFNGKKTASGEVYDMYAMTAGILPCRSRVMRGSPRSTPANRWWCASMTRAVSFVPIIDLSYTAAYKLGYLSRGSTRVRVESLDPPPTIRWAK